MAVLNQFRNNNILSTSKKQFVLLSVYLNLPLSHTNPYSSKADCENTLLKVISFITCWS